MSYDQPFTLGAVFKGGLLILIPVVILYTIGEQLVELLLIIAGPFDAELPEGHLAATVVLFAAILTVIFVVGLIGRLSLIQRAIEYVEDKILVLIPGYALIRQFARSKLDETEAEHWPAVAVTDGDGHVVGVLVDESDDTYVSVYIPFAPQGFSGVTRVVERSRVKPIEGKDAGDVIDMCLAFGQGTAGITREALSK